MTSFAVCRSSPVTMYEAVQKFISGVLRGRNGEKVSTQALLTNVLDSLGGLIERIGRLGLSRSRDAARGFRGFRTACSQGRPL